MLFHMFRISMTKHLPQGNFGILQLCYTLLLHYVSYYSYFDGNSSGPANALHSNLCLINMANHKAVSCSTMFPHLQGVNMSHPFHGINVTEFFQSFKGTT